MDEVSKNRTLAIANVDKSKRKVETRKDMTLEGIVRQLQQLEA